MRLCRNARRLRLLQTFTSEDECMRDVDTILASVRDPASREQLEDAVRAYQAGAFRAAIISTWVSVALDLVGKLRELADDGDAGAVAEIEELDKAITRGDVRWLQQFENDLLDKCRDVFELINGRDHLVLSRLAHDRNSCAHPAFVASDQVFTPTAELTRSHLVAAVDAVLEHPPTPGKRLVQRFQSEVGSGAWPSSGTALVEYLRERYFGQQRTSAKRQLAQLIVKCCLSIDPHAPNRSRLLMRYPLVARSLNEVAPLLLEQTLASVIRKKEETVGLSESEIRAAVGALGDLAAFWSSVPPASGPRFVDCIRDSTTQQLADAGVLAIEAPALGVGAEVAEIVQARLATVGGKHLAGALGVRVTKPLIEAFVSCLEKSSSWDNTNELMPFMPMLADQFGEAQVLRICGAAVGNVDIYHAYTADEGMSSLFERTHAMEGAREAWLSVARFKNPDRKTAYAYPSLHAAVFSRWDGVSP